MALSPITRHFGEGVVKLIPAFWGKPRIAALLQSFLIPVQELEDVMWQVLAAYKINTADTARLDVLGKIVGQPRFWSNDETYRAVIRAKIRTNRSRGLTTDIVEVVSLVTGTTDPVHVEHYVPATMAVWIETPLEDDIYEALAFFLPKARAAGVSLHFYWTEEGLDDAAVWDETTWDDGTIYWNEVIL
jgi:hypothetical protein